MRRLALVATLMALPVATASAAGDSSSLLFATGTGVVLAAADGNAQHAVIPDGVSTRDLAWAPDGSKAALATIAQGERSVWVVDAGGSNLRRLAASASDELMSPTFSPDGSELAYLDEASSNGPSDVWLVAASGGGPARRLTSDGGAKTEVAWSPGGDRLLVVTAGVPSTLSTIDLADGTRRELADGVTASWSPDGGRIAYLDSRLRLLVMNADGTGAREIASRAESPPVFSADGSTILFDRSTAVGPATKFGLPTRSDVFSVGADGRFPPRQLTGPRTQLPFSIGIDDGRRATFSPDGSQIYYQRFQSSTAENAVWRMNPDGTCRQPVPSLARVVLGPLWRPGAAFGAPVRCVDLRVYAVPQAEYFPVVGRAGATVTVENDGNEPATNLRFNVTASGAGARGARCVPSCTVASLDAGATGSLVVDAATSAPGAVTMSVSLRADQPSVDEAGGSTRVVLTVLPCTIVGTDGPDRLTGTSLADRICGKPGTDWIGGAAGDDRLDAGNGNDTVVGGPGHDTILGRGGRDTIFARDGQRDWIDCGTEHDVAVVDRVDHVHGCERVLRR